MMYCAHCGKPVSDQAKFCPACGYPTRLGKKLMQQGGAAGQAGGGVNLPSSLSSLDPQKKRILAGVVVAALIVCGGGAYYYHTKMDNNVSVSDAFTKKTTKLPSKGQTTVPVTPKKAPGKAADDSNVGKVQQPKESSAGDSASVKSSWDSDQAVFSSPDVVFNTSDPGKFFIYYHKNISAHHLQDAYRCFSADYQNQMGSFNSWAPGYDTTLASIPEEVQVQSNDGNQAIVSFRLKAVDKDGNGGKKTQYFRGTCQLIKENGFWKINDMSVSGD